MNPTTNDLGILYCVMGFVFGQALGSIPSGLWITKAIHGIDIREYGSKNIGTTNVLRTVGWFTAVLTLVCDVLKGVAAVIIMDLIFHEHYINGFTAMGALLGHSYSMFLSFRGGKGVATGVGLIAFLMPNVALGITAIWLVLVLATRYVSLGSIVGAAAAPFLAWYFGEPFVYVIFAAVAASLVVLRHRENIGRLLSGTESKIKPGNAKNIQK